MPNPLLIIGVGGTGAKVVSRVKERLLEMTPDGKMPPEVAVLVLDAQNPNPEDYFCGIGFDTNPGENGRPREYVKLVTNDNQTVEDAYKNRENEAIAPAWYWVDKPRLEATIEVPAQRAIGEGAGKVRPIGKMSVYLNYQTACDAIREGLEYLESQREAHNQAVQEQQEILAGIGGEFVAQAGVELDKFLVFVVGSCAGGTGSGIFLSISDIVNYYSKELFGQRVHRFALVVGPGAFAARGKLDDSNAFALLREMGRLVEKGRGALLSENALRVMHLPAPLSTLEMPDAPFDSVFFFDGKDRKGNALVAQQGKLLEQVLTPTVADFIVAHYDPAFSAFLAVVRTNWPTLKDEPGAIYGALGTRTLIFPRRDVRYSAGLHYLEEILEEYYVVTKDKRAGFDVEDLRCSSRLLGPGSEGIPPSEFARRFSTLSPTQNMKNHPFIKLAFQGQLNDIQGWFGNARDLKFIVRSIGIGENVSDSAVEDLEGKIEASLDELDTYDDDVFNQIEIWRGKYLGAGGIGVEENGLWQKWALSYAGNYQQAFRDVLYRIIEELLNDRDDTPPYFQLKYRLEYARSVLKYFIGDAETGQESRVEQFKEKLQSIYDRSIQRARKLASEIEQMSGQAQGGRGEGKYRRRFVAYARERRKLVGYNLLIHLAKELAGHKLEDDEGNVRLSAVQDVLRTLEWVEGVLQTMLTEIHKQMESHQSNRERKEAIKVRNYVTDETFEDSLYQTLVRSAYEKWLATGRLAWQVKRRQMAVVFLGLHGGNDFSGTAEEVGKWLARESVAWSTGVEDSCPFKSLGQDVDLARRLRDHYQQASHLVDVLSKATVLMEFNQAPDLTTHGQWITVCPTDPVGLSADLQLQVRKWYTEDARSVIPSLTSQLQGRYTDPGAQIRPCNGSKPAATSVELYIGVPLAEMKTVTEIEPAYWRDVAPVTKKMFPGKALHTLAEENAAVAYEMRIEREFDIRRHTLHPLIVDLLGHRVFVSPDLEREKLLEFIIAYSTGVIRDPVEEDNHTHEWLIIEEASDQRGGLRLTQSHLKNDMDLFAMNFSLTEEGQTQKSRLLFAAAVRRFVLTGKGWIPTEDAGGQIKYMEKPIPYSKVHQIAQNWLDQLGNRKDLLMQQADTFATWVRDPIHDINNGMLRDLGIVLSLMLRDEAIGIGLTGINKRSTI